MTEGALTSYYCKETWFKSNHMTKKLLLVAAVAMINDKNQLLLAKRPEGKALAGLWEFPGGKVEQGETPENALIRELYEEIGIIANIDDLLPISFSSFCYQDFHLLMPLWELRIWKNTPIANEKQELNWVDAKNLREYQVPPADIFLIDFMEKYLTRLS